MPKRPSSQPKSTPNRSTRAHPHTSDSEDYSIEATQPTSTLEKSRNVAKKRTSNIHQLLETKRQTSRKTTASTSHAVKKPNRTSDQKSSLSPPGQGDSNWLQDRLKISV